MATGEFTWTWSSPDGVYKSHAMSRKIRMAGVAETEFVPHVSTEPNFGKQSGEAVTITRVKALTEPTDTTMTETDKVPIERLQVNTTSVTVSLRGRGCEYHNLAEQLGSLDLKSTIQKRLKEQIRLTLDTSAAAAFKNGKIKAIPTGVSTITFDTDGTASSPATVNLNFIHLGIIRDYMRETIHVPPAERGSYIAILSTRAARGVKQDPDYQALIRYVQPGKLVYDSELGRVENMVIIENNHTAALSSTLGTNSDVGEAVIFGDDAVTMAEALAPELRAEVPANFGLHKAVAWVGILAFAQTWGDSNADGEAKVVHVTSS